MFHKTTPHLQDQDQDQFLVSDQSCPKTDGLRPHHCFTVTNRQTVAFISTDTYVRISYNKQPYLFSVSISASCLLLQRV